MSFRACMETNDMQLVTTKSHTVTSRETVLTVSNLILGSTLKPLINSKKGLML